MPNCVSRSVAVSTIPGFAVVVGVVNVSLDSGFYVLSRKDGCDGFVFYSRRTGVASVGSPLVTVCKCAIASELVSMNLTDAIDPAGLTYNWIAALGALAVAVGLTLAGRRIAFKVPAFVRMRELNEKLDADKIALPKYPPAVASSNRAGLGVNVVLLLLVLPLTATTVLPSAWSFVIAVLLMLLVHDFMYYMTHRFLFHGEGYFRRVHALHHQARSPSYIDALYVHPLETVIGVGIFVLSVILCSLVLGRIHFAAIAIAHVIFTQVSVLNHVKIDLPYFPFKWVHWVSAKHAIHHQNMHKGNFAGITPLYDKLFGTFE